MDRTADLEATVTSRPREKPSWVGNFSPVIERFWHFCCIAKHSVASRYQATIVIILCLIYEFVRLMNDRYLQN